ncbi:MAG: hypothetical protein HYX48_07500 [Chlamydiales bacterium]|nr:hypothetical protein [Chlamydiales bacterium]
MSVIRGLSICTLRPDGQAPYDFSPSRRALWETPDQLALLAPHAMVVKPRELTLYQERRGSPAELQQTVSQITSGQLAIRNIVVYDKLSFWKAVCFEPNTPFANKTFSEFFMELVDSLLTLSSERAVIQPDLIFLKSGGVSESVELREMRSAWWVSALKVAIYFTVAIPLLLLAIKAVLRSFHTFHITPRSGVVRAGESLAPNYVAWSTTQVAPERSLEELKRELNEGTPEREQLAPDYVALSNPEDLP